MTRLVTFTTTRIYDPPSYHFRSRIVMLISELTAYFVNNYILIAVWLLLAVDIE